MFKNPLAELELQRQIEANRPVMPQRTKTEAEIKAEQEAVERAEKEWIAAETAKRKATAEREREAARVKEEAERERVAAAAEARRAMADPEKAAERRQAEIEKNSGPNRLASCPRCRESVRLENGKLPVHQHRVPDPDTGFRYEICDPSSIPDFVASYIPKSI